MIDSDIVISFLSGDPSTRAFVNALAESGIAISVVTYMEAFHCVLESPDSMAMQAFLDAFLINAPVFPFTQEIAQGCAEIRRDLKSQGKRVRPRALDLIIAATAEHHGLALATRNITDYRDIDDLEIVSPPVPSQE